MLSVNVISNITNGSGLQRDYEILREELEALGCEVRGVPFQAQQSVRKADLNLWLEVGGPEYSFSFAKQNWLIPNPEWWRPHWDPKRFDRVLCKTHDALRLFSKLNDNCAYLGFRSVDRYREDVKKEPVFLHVMGKSPFKGTLPVLEAWAREKLPKLIVISSTLVWAPNGVEHRLRVTEDELRDLYNRCAYHLCPSDYEGWGHHLHEGMSANGYMLTTDSPVMREMNPHGLHIPVAQQWKHLLADMHRVSVKGIVESVQRAYEGAAQPFSYSRGQYLKEVDSFRTNLRQVIGEIQ